MARATAARRRRRVVDAVARATAPRPASRSAIARASATSRRRAICRHDQPRRRRAARAGVRTGAVEPTDRGATSPSASPTRVERRPAPARLRAGEPGGRCSDSASDRRSSAGGSSPACARLVDRDEADQPGEVGRREQHHRVDVAVADPEPEVEDAGVVTVAAAGGADHLARGRPAGRAGPRRSARNEYDVRSPPACATTTCSEPATSPANVTSPAFAARTGVPGGATRSDAAVPGAVARARRDERARDRARRPGGSRRRAPAARPRPTRQCERGRGSDETRARARARARRTRAEGNGTPSATPVRRERGRGKPMGEVGSSNLPRAV